MEKEKSIIDQIIRDLNELNRLTETLRIIEEIFGNLQKFLQKYIDKYCAPDLFKPDRKWCEMCKRKNTCSPYFRDKEASK